MKLAHYVSNGERFVFDTKTGTFHRLIIRNNGFRVGTKLRKARSLRNMTLWASVEETAAFLMQRAAAYILVEGDSFDRMGLPERVWLRQGDGVAETTWAWQVLCQRAPVAAFVGPIFQDGGKFSNHVMYEARKFNGVICDVTAPGEPVGSGSMLRTCDWSCVERVYVTRWDWPRLLCALRNALAKEASQAKRRDDHEPYEFVIRYSGLPDGVLREKSDKYGLSIRTKTCDKGIFVELYADDGLIWREPASLAMPERAILRMATFAQTVVPKAQNIIVQA